jgi:hypothetical protein
MRPSIAVVDRLSASPIEITDLPAARSASSRLSSSPDHLVLLFLGKVAPRQQ